VCLDILFQVFVLLNGLPECVSMKTRFQQLVLGVE
jgi:hypothetical protein